MGRHSVMVSKDNRRHDNLSGKPTKLLDKSVLPDNKQEESS